MMITLCAWKISSVYNTHREREREGYLFTWSEERKNERRSSPARDVAGHKIRDGKYFFKCIHGQVREREYFSPFFVFQHLDGIDLWIFFFLFFGSLTFVLSQKTSLRMNQSFIFEQAQGRVKVKAKANGHSTQNKLSTNWNQNKYDKSFHNFRLVLRETNKKRFLHNHYYHHNKQQTNKHGDDEQQQYQQQDQLFYYHDVPIGLFIFISIHSYFNATLRGGLSNTIEDQQQQQQQQKQPRSLRTKVQASGGALLESFEYSGGVMFDLENGGGIWTWVARQVMMMMMMMMMFQR